jgi:hypothetical protein
MSPEEEKDSPPAAFCRFDGIASQRPRRTSEALNPLRRDPGLSWLASYSWFESFPSHLSVPSTSIHVFRSQGALLSIDGGAELSEGYPTP